MMKRRNFITLLGVVATWPLAAGAQQAAVPVVGMLSAEWPNLFSDRLRAFHDGLRETGYAVRRPDFEGSGRHLGAIVHEELRPPVPSRRYGPE